jgi:hypothetical protein
MKAKINKRPYKLKGNKYQVVNLKKLTGEEVYLSINQVFEINNLLFAIKEINNEIKNIIKNGKKGKSKS